MTKIEKNVVVAIDTSITANEVLKRAFCLAKYNKIHLYIIHCIDIPWFDKLQNQKDIVQETKKKIKENIQKLDEQNINYTILVKIGSPDKIIVKNAKNLKANLIIIGTYSKENLKSKILGSNAHNIAQKSNLPVLIVKNFYMEEYKNILALTDLSKVSKKSIEFSKEFFDNATFKLVHLSKKISDFALIYYNIESASNIYLEEAKKHKEEQIEKFKAKVNLSEINVIEESGDFNEILLDLAKKEDSDLVVLGSKGVKTANSLFFGSITSFLMKNISSDILVYIPK